jgi:hypothetical protein
VGERARMSLTPPGNPLFISDVDLCHTRAREVAYVARRSRSIACRRSFIAVYTPRAHTHVVHNMAGIHIYSKNLGATYKF